MKEANTISPRLLELDELDKEYYHEQDETQADATQSAEAPPTDQPSGIENVQAQPQL